MSSPTPARDTRSLAPVFVLGCPRSGTTLLYHMLLSAGDFAIYRAESRVFDLIVPRFRNLTNRATRQDLMDSWLRSMLFERSGLDARAIRSKVLAECRSGGDFLRVVMDEIARSQNVRRWAECTPTHLLHLSEIKAQIPNALVVHIIRDGRDAALSLAAQRWIHPFRWNQDQRLLVAGFYWEWIVQRGRRDGRALGADYLEVRFEELIADPGATLARIGTFVDHDLDYGRILQAGIGSVSRPNTSFQPGSGPESDFSPVGRWREKFSEKDVREFELLLGPFLSELGYPLSVPARSGNARPGLRWLRTVYRSSFFMKHLAKTKMPLTGHLVSGAVRDAGGRTIDLLP